MEEREGRFQNMFRTAKNHISRAREGKKLLKDGKSLNNMRIPIEGPETSDLRNRRELFIKNISSKSPDELGKI